MKKKELKLNLQIAESRLETALEDKRSYFNDLVELVKNPDSDKSKKIKKHVIFQDEFESQAITALLFGDYRKGI